MRLMANRFTTNSTRMFARLKSLFRSKDARELDAATNNFDELMKMVDEDQLDLKKLERHVQDEFNEIEEGLEGIREGVDKVVKKEDV